jgi:hypothetical protein
VAGIESQVLDIALDGIKGGDVVGEEERGGGGESACAVVMFDEDRRRRRGRLLPVTGKFWYD